MIDIIYAIGFSLAGGTLVGIVAWFAWDRCDR